MQALKIWVVQMALVLCIQAQSCSRPIAVPNMILSNAFINEETFLDGAQVTFICATGYVRAGGSKSITCTAGMWSEVKMICNKISCGSPGEIQNGKFHFSEGFEFGAVVYAKCNKGYILVGSDKRTCMAEGWDNRVPVCEAVKCGDPPTILNGGPEVSTGDTYTYGDVVVYVCEKGFTMIGSSSMSCSENEQFQPSPPECRTKNCSRPVGGPNMMLSSAFTNEETFLDGAQVTFICATGYVHAGGSKSVTCTAERWSEVEMICNKISCGSPGEIENGQYDLSEGIEFGAVVYASCNESYILVGSDKRTCMAEGWNNRVPVCEAQNCSRPIAGPNMMLSSAFTNEETFLDGAQVMFICATGYVHAGGSKSVTCTAERWSKVEMICNKRSCGSPGEIENGQYDLSEGIEFGAVVYARCNKGYILVGSDNRTCMAEGWNNRVPVCEVVKCGDPPTILNGGLEVPTGDPYNYGDVVVYICEKGFTMIGSCSENEQFEPFPPECRSCSVLLFL